MKSIKPLLTQEQEAVINADGSIVVIADAGSGKTHTITQKLLRDLEQCETYKVHCALSFTVKATRELKNRIGNVQDVEITTIYRFAINEIITPFIHNVYHDLPRDTKLKESYSTYLDTYRNGISVILNKNILGSYNIKSSECGKRNFYFDLALEILKKSSACQRYIKSKYQKFYLDEYQDFDISMHNFFSYIQEKIGIELVIVGDPKQSIYRFRGANPKLLCSLEDNSSFTKYTLTQNFRSSQGIVSYSKVFNGKGNKLHDQIHFDDSILYLSASENEWSQKVVKYLDKDLSIGILRDSNDNADKSCLRMKECGIKMVYIPSTPIDTVDPSIRDYFFAIAKITFDDKYNKYSFINDASINDALLNDNNDSNTYRTELYKTIDKLSASIERKNENDFNYIVSKLFQMLGYQEAIDSEWNEKLYKTVTDNKYALAFQSNNCNEAMTVHKSKGLEFEQVIIFAEDFWKSYTTKDIYSEFHYVAITRARKKLIIIDTQRNDYRVEVEKVFKSYNINPSDVFIYC